MTFKDEISISFSRLKKKYKLTTLEAISQAMSELSFIVETAPDREYEKEEIEIIATYKTIHYKQIEACAKWYFSHLNIPRHSKREWFNLIDIEMTDFIDKALKAIELEPDHAPRWMDRYIKNRRNLHKDVKIWFM